MMVYRESPADQFNNTIYKMDRHNEILRICCGVSYYYIILKTDELPYEQMKQYFESIKNISVSTRHQTFDQAAEASERILQLLGFKVVKKRLVCLI